MQERLLQFIWKEKYFNPQMLKTVSGEDLAILHGGEYNHHQGPDFINARIILNDTTWAGNIELHIKSSDWYRHRHQLDDNYRNIILHVVWEDDDQELSRSIPTLVLQDRVPSLMLERYQQLMQQPAAIPCQPMLEEVPENIWIHWKNNLVLQRLARKSGQVLDLLGQAGQNWEECCWWWISRHFGGNVNGSFFEQVARSLPYRVMTRHRRQVIQLEALLLGQANLLDASSGDPYVQLLQREYRHLANKYQLVKVHGQVQKLRMRPASFPELRLAQLAMLVHRQHQFAVKIMETQGLREMESLLDLTANDFWHYHYTLQEATPFQPKHLGEDMVRQLVINAICPLVYAAGTRLQQPALQQKALNWLCVIPAEQNSVLRCWQREGVQMENSADSQALLELRKSYCAGKKCLDCEIGRYILQR